METSDATSPFAAVVAIGSRLSQNGSLEVKQLERPYPCRSQRAKTARAILLGDHQFRTPPVFRMARACAARTNAAIAWPGIEMSSVGLSEPARYLQPKQGPGGSASARWVPVRPRPVHVASKNIAAAKILEMSVIGRFPFLRNIANNDYATRATCLL